jgi:hypothetical protein
MEREMAGDVQRKRFLLILIAIGSFVLLSCFLPYFGCHGQEITDTVIKDKYRHLRALYAEKEQQGYDMRDVDAVIKKGRKARRKGDLSSANMFLERAFNLLNSMTGKEGLAVMPIEKVSFPESPFAVAFGEIYKGEEFMPYIRELGATCTKLYLHWHWIEPNEGQYSWHLVDSFVRQLKEGEKALIAVFTSSSWGAEGVGKGYPPKDYDKYSSFINKLVKRCNNKVKYWQRDTEPASPRHWDKTKAKEYVETQKYFYQAVKAADPTASVIGVGMNGVFVRKKPQSKEFFDYVLRHGKDYFDILDIRLYWNHYDIPFKVEWFREKMAKRGYQKPIVSTEYGGPTPVQFHEFRGVKRQYEDLWKKDAQDEQYRKRAWQWLDKASKDFPPPIRMFLKNPPNELEEKRHRINCRDVVQRTVLALSSGVQKLWYWNLISRRHPKHGPHPIFGKLRLLDERFEKRYPAFYVYKRMVDKMHDIDSIERVSTRNKDIYLFKVNRKRQQELYIVWHKRDLFHGEDQPPEREELFLDCKKVKITDIFGKQIMENTIDGKVLVSVTGTALYMEPVLK